MTHEELSDLYELYALGVLETEEQAEMEQHLARSCPQCQAGVQRAMAFAAVLGTFPEAVEPPKRLRARVLASVGVEPKTSRRWLGGLSFATACLLIGLVVLSLESSRRGEELAQARLQLRESATALKDLTRLQEAMTFLNQPDTEQVVFGKGQAAPPRGRIFVNPRQGVMLMASNLPSAPAGKLYEMWLVPKTGAAIPAGLFQTDAQGNALFVHGGSIDRGNTKAVAVTMEPAAGSAAPTSPILFAAGLSD